MISCTALTSDDGYGGLAGGRHLDERIGSGGAKSGASMASDCCDDLNFPAVADAVSGVTVSRELDLACIGAARMVCVDPALAFEEPTGIISCASDVMDLVLQCLGSGICIFAGPLRRDVVDLPFFRLVFFLVSLAASSSSLSPSKGSESSASSSFMVE